MTSPTIEAVRETAGALKTWMIEDALPLWASAGVDKQFGGFTERLDLEGHPDLQTPKRVRVQARQIYSFALAANLGWFPEGRALAASGLEYMLTFCRSPDGRPGYVHILNADGSVLDAKRDTYDHAFVLLALATAYRLFRDGQILSHIYEVVDFIDEHLTDAGGGLLDSDKGGDLRRQNPHMHMFEAMLALFEATGHSNFLHRATALFNIFRNHLFDESTGRLGEYFSSDWRRLEVLGMPDVEPGHHMEWAWLLRWYSRFSGAKVDSYCHILRNTVVNNRSADGFLVDGTDLAGTLTHRTQRFWPQIEEAKAWSAEAALGCSVSAEQARATLERFAWKYLNHPTTKGGWFDQFDERGTSLMAYQPASTLYHVLCGVAEASRVFEARTFASQQASAKFGLRWLIARPMMAE